MKLLLTLCMLVGCSSSSKSSENRSTTPQTNKNQFLLSKEKANASLQECTQIAQDLNQFPIEQQQQILLSGCKQLFPENNCSIHPTSNEWITPCLTSMCNNTSSKLTICKTKDFSDNAERLLLAMEWIELRIGIQIPQKDKQIFKEIYSDSNPTTKTMKIRNWKEQNPSTESETNYLTIPKIIGISMMIHHLTTPKIYIKSTTNPK